MPRARDAVICLEIFRPPRREQTPSFSNEYVYIYIYRRGIKRWKNSRVEINRFSPFEGIFVKKKNEIATKSIHDSGRSVPYNNTMITVKRKKKSAFALMGNLRFLFFFFFLESLPPFSFSSA